MEEARLAGTVRVKMTCVFFVIFFFFLLLFFYSTAAGGVVFVCVITGMRWRVAGEEQKRKSQANPSVSGRVKSTI